MKTKGELMLDLVRELGVEDLEVPTIGRPPSAVLQRRAVLVSDNPGQPVATPNLAFHRASSAARARGIGSVTPMRAGGEQPLRAFRGARVVRVDSAMPNMTPTPQLIEARP